MTKRSYIRMRTLLAAALGQLGGIPHQDRKAMTEDQILSLFARDHDPVPVHIGGPDEHWNIQWTYRGAHIEKTAKSDIPMLRKGDRISAAHEEFRRKILAKSGRVEPVEPELKPRKPRWASRKLTSRNDLRTKRRGPRP